MLLADVVVVGAGPAGAALAAALSGCSAAQVLVVDQPHTAAAPGQTLPAAALALLRDLGILARFEQGAHRRVLGQASIWGSGGPIVRDAFLNPQGASLLVDRAHLERCLIDHALTLGCRLMRPARVASVARHRLRKGDAELGWQVDLERDGGKMETVRCLFIVDATGRRAAVARLLGARIERLDHLVCDAVILPGGEATQMDGFSVIEAVPNGWFYGTRLSSGERLIAFHTDFDLEPARRRDPLAHLVADGSVLAQWLPRDRSVVRALPRIAAWSARLACPLGEGWAAVGDAACCFDPLSSQGVFNALYGGLRLGSALGAGLFAGSERRLESKIGQDTATGDASRLQDYGAELESVWNAYRAHLSLYYRAETRWTRDPFWRRRAFPGPTPRLEAMASPNRTAAG